MPGEVTTTNLSVFKTETAVHYVVLERPDIGRRRAHIGLKFLGHYVSIWDEGGNTTVRRGRLTSEKVMTSQSVAGAPSRHWVAGIA